MVEKTLLVECSDKICEKINSITDVEDRMFIEKIVRLIRKNPKISAEEIAEQLNIGRSTVFYRLKNLGLSLNDIKEALKKEVEEKQQKKVKMREVKELPPVDYQDFLSRDVVKKVVARMDTAMLSNEHKERVLRFWFRICRDLSLAPSDFEDPNNEVKELIEQYLSKVNGEKRARIALAQALQKWLGVQILAPSVEQAEYKGKYQTAEIPLSVREKIVRDLIKMYQETKNDIYIKTIKTIVFLFFTGSRAEALKTFSVVDRVVLNSDVVKRVYGETTFVIIKTEEKGKKGNKLMWTKIIPSSWGFAIPRTRLTEWEIKKIRKILKSIIMNYINELNNDTVAYLKKGKTLHVWRHTSAREFLKAFQWNRYLVSKLLGWEKDSNLRIYGDYGLLELLQQSHEHRIIFVSNELKEELKKVFQA